MSPEIAKGKYVYYSCTNARREICNKKTYIPEKDFLKPVYDILRAFSTIPQQTIDTVVEGLKKSCESKYAYNNSILTSLQKQYNELQERISRTTDIFIDGQITKETYDSKIYELKGKQRDINIQIENHTNADENYHITASTVLSLAKNALKLFESSEVPEKRKILSYLLQNCTTTEKTLTYELRSPFNVILDLKTSSMLRE